MHEVVVKVQLFAIFMSVISLSPIAFLPCLFGHESDLLRRMLVLWGLFWLLYTFARICWVYYCEWDLIWRGDDEAMVGGMGDWWFQVDLDLNENFIPNWIGLYHDSLDVIKGIIRNMARCAGRGTGHQVTFR